MSKGMWIDKETYVNFGEQAKSLQGEFATRERSIDFSYLGLFLPNPDPVLKKLGQDIRIYNDLLVDSFLAGCVRSRKAGLLSMSWGLDRGSARSKVTKVIETALKKINITNTLQEMLSYSLFGYSVHEVVWDRVDNYILPVAIKEKPQFWFTFLAKNNELRLRTKVNWVTGDPLPPRKFLLLQHEPSYANPYGNPILAQCFWPVTFKKAGLKFWAIFVEKYGMPFLVGKHPRGVNEQEVNAFADELENLVQDAIAVIPDDSNVTTIETRNANSTGELQSKFIDSCKTEISIAVLGQNLTTEIKGGSFAASEVHMRVRKDMIDQDKKQIEFAFNRLIKWICEINFGDSVEPPVFCLVEKEDIDKELAARDQLLVTTGLKFTKKYYLKAYGFNDDEIELNPQEPIPSAKGVTSGTYSESQEHTFPDQAAIDNAADSLSPKDIEKLTNGILAPVIKLVKEGKSYEDIMSNLAQTFPDMDTKSLEKMLSRAIFVSELWGMHHAND